MAKRKPKLSKTRLTSLLKRYKKIKIVFGCGDDLESPECERVLTINGSCVVREKYSNYRHHDKWTRYRTSCFCCDIRDGYHGQSKDKAKQIIDVMVDYVAYPNPRYIDRQIISVLAGPGFKRKVG